MKGVTFGSYHSYTDWGLILSSKEIKAPEPKTMQIDIEGSDGFLDLTDFFGDTNYMNRSLSFQFTKETGTQAEYLTLYSTIQDAIHGKKMNVVLDDDNYFYYSGRVILNEWKSEKSIGSIVIEVDAEPWKYKNSETVVSRTISTSESITLTNSRKKVVPTITTTASMTFRFNNSSYSASAGTFKIPQIELVEGNNTIIVTGSGTVTFRYREGKL